MSIHRVRGRSGAEVAAVLDATPRWSVTLVHGTFNLGRADWTQAGSRLRQVLLDSNKHLVEFHAFGWSGRNTARARYEATLLLRKHLRDVIDANPDVPHLVIGHSHGGAIALDAACDRRLGKALAGVFCLSTPFFVVEKRPISLAAGVGLLALVVLAVGGLPFFSSLFPDFTMPSPIVVPFAGTVLLTLATVLAITVGASERIAKYIEPVDYNLIDRARVLLLRQTGDEVSAGFGAAQLVSTLVDKTWSRLESLVEALLKMRYWLAAAAVAAFLLHILFDASGELCRKESVPEWDCTLQEQIGFGLGLVAAFIVGFVSIAVLCALALPLVVFVLATTFWLYGGDLTLVATLMRIHVESTPPGRWVVHLITNEDDKITNEGDESAWRHSQIYENPAAIRKMLDLMRDVDASLSAKPH